MGQHIKLTASDGFKLGGYRADPAGAPKAAIVVIQEIFGVNHHIRFSQAHKGMAGLGLAMGAVVAAMPLIVSELNEADTQQLIHIKGLNPASKHRFERVDPSVSPPSYWPR